MEDKIVCTGCKNLNRKTCPLYGNEALSRLEIMSISHTEQLMLSTEDCEEIQKLCADCNEYKYYLTTRPAR